MRAHRCYFFTIVVLAGMWIVAAGAHARVLPQSDAGKMQNPVPSDAASIAAGKKIYDEQCVECHGEAGKGDGPRAPYTDPSPPDLTDADWKHGSTDGEIFAVIQKGVPSTEMAAFEKDIPERQAWDVVNYVKSLGAKP